MADFSKPIELPSVDDIASINASLINSYGGFLVAYPNIRPDGPGLDYLLAAITYPLGETDLFPTIIDKATFTAIYIITRHPFFDTNKRTGMEAALELLELNGFTTHFKPADVIQVALDVEAGLIDFVSLRNWILMNITEDLSQQ